MHFKKDKTLYDWLVEKHTELANLLAVTKGSISKLCILLIVTNLQQWLVANRMYSSGVLFICTSLCTIAISWHIQKVVGLAGLAIYGS